MSQTSTRPKTKQTFRHQRWCVLLLIVLLTACIQMPTPTQAPGNATPTALPTKSTPIGLTPRPLPIATSTPTPTSSLGVVEEELQGVQVYFWHPWAGETGKTIKMLIEEFNQNNEWGIEAYEEYKGGFDEVFEVVSKAFEDGNAPDLVTGYYYQGLIWNLGEDYILDINPYMTDSVWGLSVDEQNGFYPAFIQQEFISGKRIGLPAERSAQLLYYNLSWAKELGFNAAPKTPAQFKRQACAAASANMEDEERSNDGTGGLILSTDYDAILNWLTAFQAQYFKPDENVYSFNTDEVEEAFTYLRELYDEGCAWLSESELPAVEFASRQGLFTMSSVVDIPLQEGVFADLSSKDEWDIIPFPTDAGEQKIVVYGPSFMILRSNPRKQLAAWVLTKWLTSSHVQAQIARTSAHLPVRSTSLESMGILPQKYPQWLEAIKLVDSAIPEPQTNSWYTVRWAVSDAATQLFRYYFTIDQVPTLVELLDETANDLHKSRP